MKNNRNIYREKPIEVSLIYRNFLRRLLHRIFKPLVTISMVVFLLMIVAPANASDSGKNRDSKCRARQTGFSYPVIMKKKNKHVSYKKHLKMSRTKRMPFLV